jgi:hypothetical protein
MTNQPPLSEGDLAGFIGTENWYRNSMFPRFTYTDGIKYMAERAGAYWLIDVILSHQRNPKALAVEFQVWTVKLITTGRNNGGCRVAMTDGNTDAAIISQTIPYTDFPLTDFSVYLTGDVLMLKSEY